MMKHLNLSLVRVILATAFCIFINSTTATAQDKPDGTPLFSILSTNEWWDVNTQPSGRLTSKLKAGGSTWSTVAFMHIEDYSGLWCGFRDIPYVATLTSDSPIADEIGIVSAYFSFMNYMENLNSVTLRIASDNDFTNYTDITVPKLNIGAAYWNFEIPEPKAGMYYQLRVDFEAIAYNWIELEQVEFYAPKDLSDIDNIFDMENGTSDVDKASSPIDGWYNLQGQKIACPNPGLNIRIQNGHAIKILR